MPLFGLTVPWWIKYLVVPAVSLFIPWLGALLSAIIKIIEGLPVGERKEAIAELVAASKIFRKTGDSGPLAQVTTKYHQKYCDGVACPVDIKSE